MKCFEIDFNNPNWFTVIETAEDDYELFEIQDLPEVGEEVFVFSLETKTMKRFREDAGFGYVTRVTEVRPCRNNPNNCYAVMFENTYRSGDGDISQD